MLPEDQEEEEGDEGLGADVVKTRRRKKEIKELIG